MREIFILIQQSPLGEIIAAGLGLIWGSFFNVCIVRLPADEDIVFRASKCPKCSHSIRWYHNIPVLSYICLRGKCAFCKDPISIQYPIVELVTAAFFVWLYIEFGWTLRFLICTVFVSSLIVISVIDIYHRIIPDEISLGGIVVGFLFSFVNPDVLWWESLLGVLAGGGSFFLVAFIYEKITKREGLGGGDVKLLGMMGAFLGYQSILPIIVISSAAGSIIGIAIMLFQKGNLKSAIPFGPFMAAGAIAYVFWGDFIRSLLFPAFNQ